MNQRMELCESDRFYNDMLKAVMEHDICLGLAVSILEELAEDLVGMARETNLSDYTNWAEMKKPRERIRRAGD